LSAVRVNARTTVFDAVAICVNVNAGKSHSDLYALKAERHASFIHVARGIT
jgi:hypothetical protein